MIHVEGLNKQFGSRRVLEDITFQVHPAEVYAYLGPNGAGKTTTIRILTGLTRRDAGRIRLNGRDIDQSPMLYKAQFGFVPQATSLDAELSVEENLVVHGRLHHMPRRDISRGISRVLADMDIEDRRKSLVASLSGGLKRRLMIARALLHEPKVLFLDEPSVGLDPAIRRGLWGLIKAINARGTTIFLTSHYIEEAEYLAHRVAFLDSGKVVAEDAPTSLTGSMGEWAVDYLEDSRLRTVYFRDRAEAGEHARQRAQGCTLRRVNLEDAFLSMTGRKIA